MNTYIIVIPTSSKSSEYTVTEQRVTGALPIISTSGILCFNDTTGSKGITLAYAPGGWLSFRLAQSDK